MHPAENDVALPQAGHADIRIVAATPEVARVVAEMIRRCFPSTEQRSYPVAGGGTRLHLTAAPALPRHTAGRPLAPTGAHGDEV
ncbi:hypothetical protein [Streptomyces sp. SP18CS02]|uniref:hypothetical protein n=1 Tax=Streptomyces sp. SP18CS02 TaxID=3002531 RepID=UPI002E79B0A5|nr:hypothetical protein [Streptomyces sp. SP18CS02]MEE1753532.1 hypothetical protein [Streptomyces sp. SP18CS02]